MKKRNDKTAPISAKEKILLSDCDFKKEKGQWQIFNNNQEVWHDWYNENYDWLDCALSAIKKVKIRSQTLELLITLRKALREDYVQGWNEQDILIWNYISENDMITIKQINLFLQVARNNDKKHHGQITF